MPGLKTRPQHRCLFPCEYCKIFKNTYFEEHLRTAASEPKTVINREMNESEIFHPKSCLLWVHNADVTCGW